MQIFTDYELAKQYLKGNEEAFDDLVKRYVNLIYRFVFGYVKDQAIAEDITQQVFLKVWKNIKKIDKNKNFKSWIYTIAKNTTLDYLKKKKAIPFSTFEMENGKNILTDGLVDPLKLPDKISEALEIKNIFAESLKMLSEKYKQVLSLYYYQYLNFREIAELLEEPINTIKSRHRRGLILLRERIKDSYYS